MRAAHLLREIFVSECILLHDERSAVMKGKSPLLCISLFLLCVYSPATSHGGVVSDQSTLMVQQANIALKRSYQCGVPDLHNLSRMLDAHVFSALESQFEDMLQQYKEEMQCEQYLQASYNLFNSTNAISLDDLDLWVKKTGSYVAFAARGIYKAQQGFKARGDEFDHFIAAPLSKKVAEMQHWHQDAAKDLMTAVDKNPALMPAYAWMISIAKASSLPFTPKQILQQAEAIDKRTFFVRYEYILSLQPRWGGSYEEMGRYAAQALKYNYLNPRLWTLQGEADADRADAKFAKGDHKSAIEFYTAALKFGDRTLWLNKRAGCYNSVGAKDKSVHDSARVGFYNPGDGLANDNSYRNKQYLIEYELTENSFISPNLKKEGIRTYAVLPVEHDAAWAKNKESKIKGVDVAKRNVDKIELLLLQLGFECVERVKLEALLSEQKLSLTGLTIDKAQYVGKLINADAVVLTTIPSMGLHADPYQYFEVIDIKAVSVASGKIMWKSNLKGNTARGNVRIDNDIIFDNIETKLYELLQKKIQKEIL